MIIFDTSTWTNHILSILFCSTTQHTQNNCITSLQCCTIAGPTLYKCYTNVLCLLGGDCMQFFVVFLATDFPMEVSMPLMAVVCTAYTALVRAN